MREKPPAPSRPGEAGVDERVDRGRRQSGSSSASTRCTSATVPTGSTSVRCAASLPAELTDWPATLMRIDHQPNGRQRIHWLASIAWMRPGGMVWLPVESSPCPMRTPSGVPAIE